MLHKDPFIIAPQTFALIQDLQKIEFLKDFYLVGGTALALQLGHRNSIDIDLFTQQEFLADDLKFALSHFDFFASLYRNNTVLSVVNNVKTDFIRHDYNYLKPFIIEDGVRMVSKDDIAAMKVHAIIQSGKRLKDFIDIYFLLEHFSLNQIVALFSQKYGYINPMLAVKALNYFDDIDENIDPPKLLKPLPLIRIKSRIQEATLHSNHVFT